MEKRYFNVSEACEYLNISRATLYKLMKEGVVRSFKLGGVKFDKEDLDSYVETLKKPKNEKK